jgi:hypothetical protein
MRMTLIILSCFSFLLITGAPGELALASVAESTQYESHQFPTPLESYHDHELGLMSTLANRIKSDPFNLVATLIFFCAIIHTFLTSKFLAAAHRNQEKHRKKIAQGLAFRNTIDPKAGFYHFMGEVEAVFGIWAIVLGATICVFYDWHTLVGYITYNVDFTEAMFVISIMTLASTRPILKLAERFMKLIADLFGGSLAAWWFTILTLGPALSSVITEPAAMTISALLLANKLYVLEPSTKFKYATIGLLFVNVSVGGTLTNFAAPPVLMVAGPWEWGTGYMLTHFGWKAMAAILLSTATYFMLFRGELANLQEKYALKSLKEFIQATYLGHRKMDAEIDQVLDSLDREGFLDTLKMQLEKKYDEIKDSHMKILKEHYAAELEKKGIELSVAKEAYLQRFEEIKLLRMREKFPALLPEDKRPESRDSLWDTRDDAVPFWVTVVHIVFMAWVIINAHHAPFVIAGLLFFLGFAHISATYQNTIDLKSPLMVGFFLSGLVIHGGLQSWWIAPVLGNLSEIPLLLAATGLTAFNDNAAITYLSTLVPGFTEELKYFVLAGAVSGGGLTVIANAPNPAGQSLLKGYFTRGVSPAGLLMAALFPTLVVLTFFLVFS